MRQIQNLEVEVSLPLLAQCLQGKVMEVLLFFREERVNLGGAWFFKRVLPMSVPEVL
jgi:hypothetical protein